MKVGIGYDIHRLVKGRELFIGGVRIPYDRGLLGHSDGDVLIHSIIEALLGASNLGNIGEMFPDTDERYRNISSVELLKITIGKIRKRVVNIDSVIICETPRLSPYIEHMEKNISRIIGIDADSISIKPRTNEGLDSIGEGKAIAAYTVCLLEGDV